MTLMMLAASVSAPDYPAGQAPVAGSSASRAAQLLADDPWWLYTGKAVVLLGILIVLTLFNIWFERRVVARMQHRIGPNRNGPFGLLQSLADGIKLMLKEDLIPQGVDRAVYLAAPVIAAIPALTAIAVIPFGPEVSIFGQRTVLQLADYPVGVLMVVALASVGIYGIVLAGWSSGSTYPLLGGLRSSAQMISYEAAMALSFVAVFIYAGSMSTAQIVQAQSSLWFGLALAPSLVIYLVAMVGETNRAPFDLPESEGELVGGFQTEYSSMKFAMFYLAEYINMVTVSAVATTLFLGGWRAPWPLSIWEGANTGWWPVLWFLGKVLALIFVFIWLRGTLPRLRYDQFMALGWKVLIPASLGWIVAVGVIRAVLNRSGGQRSMLFVWIGAGLVLVVLVLTIWDRLTGADSADEHEQPHPVGGTTTAFDPMADGFPVPALPGQHLATAAASPAPSPDDEESTRV